MTEPVIYCSIGGALFVIFPIVEYTMFHTNDMPPIFNLRTLFLTLFYASIGALLGHAYFKNNGDVSLVLCLQIGISVPTIIRTAISLAKPKG